MDVGLVIYEEVCDEIIFCVSHGVFEIICCVSQSMEGTGLKG